MKTTKNILSVIGSGMGMTALGLCSSILLSRALGPRGRGLMSTALLWPQILAWGCGLSLGYANIYYGASNPALRRRLFANSLLMAFTLGPAAGAISCFVLLRALHPPAPVNLLLGVGLFLLPVNLLADYAVSIIQSGSEFTRFGVIRVAGPLVTVASLLCLAAARRLGVAGAVASFWAGQAVQLGLTLCFLARSGAVGFRADGGLLRDSLRDSSRVFGGTLLNLANKRMDQLLMTAVVAPSVLGLYAFAVTFSELLQQVTGAISLVLLPRVAAAPEAGARRAVAAKAVRMTFVVAAAGAAAMAAAAPVAVPLIWGRPFAAAVKAIWVLLPGTVALAGTASMCAGLQGAGRPTAGLLGETASFVLMLPLLLLLLPRYGIVGAAVASTAGYAMNCSVTSWLFVREFGALRLLSFAQASRDLTDARVAALRLLSRRRAAAFTPEVAV